MNNQIAIGLGVLIVLAVVADQVWLDGSALLFLARKLFDMIEWMAFWR